MRQSGVGEPERDVSRSSGHTAARNALNLGEVRIRRVYNNNVILAEEPDGTEVVLVRKGIGFRRRAGELTQALQAERFVPESEQQKATIARLLTDAPPEVVEVIKKVYQVAKDHLQLQSSLSLELSLLDHLTFAIERARRGMEIDFPLQWEVECFYPDEAALGRWAVELVEERVGVRLHESEWAASALHLVNAQYAKADMSKTVALTRATGRVLEVLEDAWGIELDRSDFDVLRFATHVRALFFRISNDQPQSGLGKGLMRLLESLSPDAVALAERVGAPIEDASGRRLHADEHAYLALHITRLEEQLGINR